MGRTHGVCPVLCFETYVSKTREFRSKGDNNLFVLGQLFLGISHPHSPVKACIIARWVKTTPTNAGVDTTTFSVHFIRCASTSKALEGGATLSEVLQQADWSRAHLSRTS